MTLMDYIEEAAAALRKMQDANDTELEAAQYPGDRRPLIDRGLRIAEGFAQLEALRRPQDADAQVEAVLDILAPKPDVDPEYLAALGFHPDTRVPVIQFDFDGGRTVRPSPEQIRALAERIVTAIRTAAGAATAPAPQVPAPAVPPTVDEWDKAMREKAAADNPPYGPEPVPEPTEWEAGLPSQAAHDAATEPGPGGLVTFTFPHGTKVTVPPDPYAAAAADLYAHLIVTRAVKGPDWGSDAIGETANWLTSHGVDTSGPLDPDPPGREAVQRYVLGQGPKPPSGPCICEGRGGHTDPACPWFGTDTP